MIMNMCRKFKRFLPHKNRGFRGQNGQGNGFILPCPKMQFSFSTHIKNIVIHKTGITIFFKFYNIAICENYFCSDNNIMSYGFSGLVSRTIYPLPCTLDSGMSFGIIVI